MTETWTPTLDSTGGTLHERLLHAIRDDIASGELLPEDQLPTQRDLAARLGIGVGTVTRAYAEAERLGLVTSTVGRGTFVAAGVDGPDDQDAPGGPIDLSLNLQSHPAAIAMVGEALARLSLRPDFAQTLSITPHAGLDWQRQTIAGWLRRSVHYENVDWRRLMVTTGAQQAMSLVIGAFCRPGEVILSEAVTFSGFRELAAHRGVRVVGVGMDPEGIDPVALERAVAATGSRWLYLMPTLQNPTTRTMSRTRREEIARIARKLDLNLIEDDVYGPLAFVPGPDRPDLVPIASLAPERTFYLSTASKAIAMGLRVGMLVAPDEDRFAVLSHALRVDCYASSSIAASLVCQMIKDGSADDLRIAVAREAGSRMALACRTLGDAIAPPSFTSSLHAWMPMGELEAERLANRAMRRGVILTPPASFVIDGQLESGLRLCLNAISRPALERALVILRGAIADDIVPGRLAIV